GGGDLADTGDPSPDRRLAVQQALLRADRGELVDAARLRARIGAADPALLAPLEATLFLGRGLPTEALAALRKRGDRRACLLRGRALLDLGRPAEAQVELAAARALGADDDVVALEALAAILSQDPTGKPAASGKASTASSRNKEVVTQALATL